MARVHRRDYTSCVSNRPLESSDESPRKDPPSFRVFFFSFFRPLVSQATNEFDCTEIHEIDEALYPHSLDTLYTRNRFENPRYRMGVSHFRSEELRTGIVETRSNVLGDVRTNLRCRQSFESVETLFTRHGPASEQFKGTNCSRNAVHSLAFARSMPVSCGLLPWPDISLLYFTSPATLFAGV